MDVTVPLVSCCPLTGSDLVFYKAVDHLSANSMQVEGWHHSGNVAGLTDPSERFGSPSSPMMLGGTGRTQTQADKASYAHQGCIF